MITAEEVTVQVGHIYILYINATRLQPQRQVDLHSKFQDSQGYVEIQCLKNIRNEEVKPLSKLFYC